MIWNLENKVTNKIDTWYSKDTIDKIKELLEPVLYAGHCSQCDGCGVDEGCGDFECGTFAATKIMEILNET